MLDRLNIPDLSPMPPRRRDPFTVCPALQAEAADLAALTVIASEGLCLPVWRACREPGESAFRAGMRQARRKDGAFSYRNADIAMQAQKTIAAIVSTPPDLLAQPGAADTLPPVFRPLAALEAAAGDSWRIKYLATHARARGQGAATALLRETQSRAQALGAARLSLIVGDANPARLLFQAFGFRDTRDATALDGGPDTPRIPHDRWILMEKAI